MSEYDPGRRAVVKLVVFTIADAAFCGALSSCARFFPPESSPGQVGNPIEPVIIYPPTPTPVAPQKEPVRNVEKLAFGMLHGFARENIPARLDFSDQAGVVNDKYNYFPKDSLVRVTPWMKVNGQEWGKVIHDTSYTSPSLIRPIASADIFVPMSELRILKSPDLASRNGSVDPKLKRIEVALDKQRLTAYEGNKEVFTTLVATGISGFDTPRGEYRISRVRLSRYMAGDDYVYPGVPFDMYFNNGQAIHGAYWPVNFGVRASHGCVNLPLDASAWVFNWIYKPIRGESLLTQEEQWISPQDQNATLVVIK
jgi:hypothetical protein